MMKVESAAEANLTLKWSLEKHTVTYFPFTFATSKSTIRLFLARFTSIGGVSSLSLHFLGVGDLVLGERTIESERAVFLAKHTNNRNNFEIKAPIAHLRNFSRSSFLEFLIGDLMVTSELGDKSLRNGEHLVFLRPLVLMISSSGKLRIEWLLFWLLLIFLSLFTNASSSTKMKSVEWSLLPLDREISFSTGRLRFSADLRPIGSITHERRRAEIRRFAMGR